MRKVDGPKELGRFEDNSLFGVRVRLISPIKKESSNSCLDEIVEASNNDNSQGRKTNNCNEIMFEMRLISSRQCA